MSEIKNLKPACIWRNFYSLTQVPRPSGHLEKIQQFLLDFGRQAGVTTFKDPAGNIVFRKAAAPGMENRKGVILQAHMDMVPQKTPESTHNFETDPIEPWIDGEWVKAKGTTLGADNGLGVAAIMAIMEDKTLKHGPINALITRDEETGMFGANELPEGELQGDILLNLDSEHWGKFVIGSAGGIDITATLDYQEVDTDTEDAAVRVTVKNLRGGHSGLEINEGRGNANKLLVQVVREAIAEVMGVEAGEVVEMKEMMLERQDKMEQMLQRVAKVLAQNTQYATMISAPQTRGNKVKFVQLSRVDEGQILAVIVVEGNVIKNNILNVREELSDETLLKLNLLLNTNLTGLSISEINLGMISAMKQQAGIHSDIVSEVIDAVADAIKAEEDLEIYTSGTNNIFRYPELADQEKASELINTFEEKDQLENLLNNDSGGENTGIQVYIGNESPVSSMRDCSVVTATYELGDGMRGTIGIVGPKRMDYDKVVGTLKTLQSKLDEIYKDHG